MHTRNMIGSFCYSITPNVQFGITDSYTKSLEPQYSNECWGFSFPSSECPFSFSISLDICYHHTLLALITHLEKGTLDKVSFFDQSEACHEPVLRKEKALSFKINGLTLVLQLLCQDACNRVLCHGSDCPREALFGTMGQKRKTPGSSTISTMLRRHQSYKC